MQPRTFTDDQKRVWSVAVVYNSIVNVHAQVGIDLRQLVEDHDHVARELDDPAKLKQVVSILLADQLEQKKLSVNDLFTAIVNEAQATDMTMAVYQATFDFFQSQGEVLNDALTKVQRAMETAKKLAGNRMRAQLDSGNMDKFLAIVTDPVEASKWIMASQDKANTDLAAAWQLVIEAELPKEDRLDAFIRLCVERGLELPTPPDPPATFKKPTNGSTSTASVGASPASSVSTPAPSPGASST